MSQKRSYLSKTEESRCCRVKGGRQGGPEPGSATSKQEQRPWHPPAVEIHQHISHLGDQEARSIGEDSVSTSYTWGPEGPLILFSSAVVLCQGEGLELEETLVGPCCDSITQQTAMERPLRATKCARQWNSLVATPMESPCRGEYLLPKQNKQVR